MTAITGPKARVCDLDKPAFLDEMAHLLGVSLEFRPGGRACFWISQVTQCPWEGVVSAL